MNETFSPAIKYERPFDPDKLKEYMWKQSQDNEFTNARAPCFTGTSVEELFYCEDHFRDAMAQLEKPEGVWFAQWRSLLHGLPRDIWMEVLRDGDPEDDGQPFDEEDEDGFFKAMEQYTLQYSPKKNSKTCQLKAMAGLEFKFKRGVNVAEHITRLRQILKYTDRLPGRDAVQPFDSKMIIFETFPIAWKQTFLDKSIDSFDSCRIIDIIQHMDQSATKAAYNDQKNKKDTKNKQNNGRRGGRGWRSQRNRDRNDNGGTFGGRNRGGRGGGRGRGGRG